MMIRYIEFLRENMSRTPNSSFAFGKLSLGSEPHNMYLCHIVEISALIVENG